MLFWQAYHRGTGLKDETRAALQPGQYGCGRVEERSVAQVRVRPGHDLRTRRLAGREDADEPAIFSKLLKKPVRQYLGSPIEDDDVIGRVGGITVSGGSRLQSHIPETERR